MMATVRSKLCARVTLLHLRIRVQLKTTADSLIKYLQTGIGHASFNHATATKSAHLRTLFYRALYFEKNKTAADSLIKMLSGCKFFSDNNQSLH